MWMAQANESNVWVVPPIDTSKALSYVLPQVSQDFMRAKRCKRCAADVTIVEHPLLYPHAWESTECQCGVHAQRDCAWR